MTSLTRLVVVALAASLLALPLSLITIASVAVTAGMIALLSFDYARPMPTVRVRG